MKQLDILRSYHIPIGSAVHAIQFLSDRHTLTPKEYLARIRELMENDGVMIDDRYVRHTYLYLVQDIIRESFNTDNLNMNKIFSGATEKAIKFVTENPYVLAGSTAEPKLDVNGNAKPRKGAKKEKAKEVYNEKILNKGLSRKDAIAILVAEVDLTPAGASTYYANLKKGTL